MTRNSAIGQGHAGTGIDCEHSSGDGTWRCPSSSTTASSMSPTGSARTRSTATCSAPRSCRGRSASRTGSARCSSICMGRASIRPRSRGCRCSPATAICASSGSGPIADAIAHLRALRRAIHAGPMQRFGAGGDGTSVYFRDPDGSLLEFISYQPEALRSPDSAQRAVEATASRCARAAANTLRNISGVSTPVLVL